MLPVVLYIFIPVLFTLGIIRYRTGTVKALTASDADYNKSSSHCNTNNSICIEIEKSALQESSQSVAQTVKAAAESKTLMEEEPYSAVVLNKYIPFTCSKCFAWNPLTGVNRVNLKPCSGCQVLCYCSEKCQKADRKDHKVECKCFRTSNGFIPHEITRLVSRMITKSKAKPDWKAYNGRTYDSLMNHCEEQRKSESVMAGIKNKFPEIQQFMGKKAPDFETFFLVYSKIVINSFAIPDGSINNISRGCGVYIGISIHDHSCRPDAFVVFKGSKLLLRTTNMQSVYSDKLMISYIGSSYIKETEFRRAYLERQYYFTCKCDECMDLERDSKIKSGRPECCPNGWFSTSDLRCCVCRSRVNSNLGQAAKMSNDRLSGILRRFKELQPDREMGQLLELFENSRKVLSDENAFLMELAGYISEYAFDSKIRLKFVDICLPYKRQLPFDRERVTFFCYRFNLYNSLKMPFRERKDALEEALETIKIVFGPDHEITIDYLEKHREYDQMGQLIKNGAENIAS